MPVAYIQTLRTPSKIYAFTLSGKLRFDTMLRDDDGILTSFQNNDSGSNPNTFSLGAGVYRVDAFFCAGGDVGPADVSRGAVAFYDETLSLVRGLFTARYESATATVFESSTPSSDHNFIMSMRTRFEIGQGERTFSFRALGSQFIYGVPRPHGVTATLGGAALSNPILQVKVTKTA